MNKFFRVVLSLVGGVLFIVGLESSRGFFEDYLKIDLGEVYLSIHLAIMPFLIFILTILRRRSPIRSTALTFVLGPFGFFYFLLDEPKAPDRSNDNVLDHNDRTADRESKTVRPGFVSSDIKTSPDEAGTQYMESVGQPGVGEILSAVEDKILEKSILMQTFKCNNEAEIYVAYEWTTDPEYKDDIPFGWLVIRVSSEGASVPDDDTLETFADRVTEIVDDSLRGEIEEELVDKIQDVVGTMVLLNGKKIY